MARDFSSLGEGGCAIGPAPSGSIPSIIGNLCPFPRCRSGFSSITQRAAICAATCAQSGDWRTRTQSTVSRASWMSTPPAGCWTNAPMFSQWLRPASTAKFCCTIGVDSVMFSLDSTTPETLMKVRGVDKLAKIEAAVFRLLRIRGDRELPRVGVSITIQSTNRHEADEFVERWVGTVDVVRTGIVFENGTFPDMVEPPKRVPCAVIYKTMPVHNDGSVRLCCLDGVRATDMGNVFEKGVKDIWQGEEFAKARYYHEREQWDKVPFCKGCNGWAQYEYSEEIRDGLLIRRSPEYVYYNLINRLASWKGNLLGGHKPPPEGLV